MHVGAAMHTCLIPETPQGMGARSCLVAGQAPVKGTVRTGHRFSMQFWQNPRR